MLGVPVIICDEVCEGLLILVSLPTTEEMRRYDSFEEWLRKNPERFCAIKDARKEAQ